MHCAPGAVVPYFKDRGINVSGWHLDINKDL